MKIIQTETIKLTDEEGGIVTAFGELLNNIFEDALDPEITRLAQEIDERLTDLTLYFVEE